METQEGITLQSDGKNVNMKLGFLSDSIEFDAGRGIRMKIKSIELRNVKCFKNEIIDMRIPETEDILSVGILVGANGAGKSTIMTGLDSRYGGELLKDSDIYFDEDSLEVQLNLIFNENERKKLGLKTDAQSVDFIYVHDRGSDADTFKCPRGITENKFKQLMHKIENCREIGSVMYYDPFRFISAKNPLGPNLQLENEARNNALQSNILFRGESTCRDLELKQWVVNMDYRRLKEPSSKNMEIFDHMVKAFNLLMHPLVFQCIDAQGAIVFKDEKENKDISLDMLSDGFKSVFFISIDIIRRLSLAECLDNVPFYKNEAIVLVDEIDCHIHPRWQRKILPSLRELFPNCQFIVTTHSPYILDGMPDDSIRKIGEKRIE